MKGAIYNVAVATVIFWHVKIRCYFHMWRYQVFARKLTWYFIGVYIINCINSFTWMTVFMARIQTAFIASVAVSNCTVPKPLDLWSESKFISARTTLPEKHSSPSRYVSMLLILQRTSLQQIHTAGLSLRFQVAR